VHDDLPSLDDDRERRGAPSVWAQYGEATAILAGDALLAEALRLALSYPSPAVARELVDATLAMIAGQQLDLEGDRQLERLHALKTGALFSASVMCALWAAEVPVAEHPPWRAFAAELGLLFQIVDDVLDGDGYVLEVGEERARRLADDAAERAQARLTEIDSDTAVLAAIVDGLAARTS
jgi:geranylgeranyl diphosphate synthase type II